MDVVRILTLAQLKASLQTLKPKQKFFLSLFLLSLLLSLVPQRTLALTIKAPTARRAILVFDKNDKTYLNILNLITALQKDREKKERIRQEALFQGKLATKVKSYLEARNSPLADHAATLVSVKNWKRIVALANAESSMCRNYPVALANCWGVGGTQLWDMGDNLSQGILKMNEFLSNYPLKSRIKYSQMTFNQMNGFYKQPAAEHWLYNVQSVYEDLNLIEKSI